MMWKAAAIFILERGSVSRSRFGTQAAFLGVCSMLLVSLLLAGCVSSGNAPAPFKERTFAFPDDAFAYANELYWEYEFDEEWNWTTRRREPPPAYAHHCFVVARAARQFFEVAEFDPAQPVALPETYRELVRQVVGFNLRRAPDARDKVVIPGYASLREFSQVHEALLKAECGGAWQSYVQRGHWRMILPFTRGHQERMAAQLVRALERNRPPVVHLVCFPRLTINHAMVLIGAEPTPAGMAFSAYDPNLPERPAVLYYDAANRTFEFPPNDYFPGGKINVYEVYHSCFY
jgi:hypothetical protein